MDLSARDIHDKQFHDSWRGYNQEEVDEFLDRLADIVDRLQRENAALNARVTELDHAVATSRDTEEMLKKTLITAQQAAEEAIANAKARAEALIQDAEERTRQVHREADEKLQSADAEARRKSLEADREHTVRKREIDASLEKLRRFESDLKRRLTAFLGEQTRALERLTEEEPPRYEPPKHEADTEGSERPYDDAPSRAPAGHGTPSDDPLAVNDSPLGSETSEEGAGAESPDADPGERPAGTSDHEATAEAHDSDSSEPTGSWIPDFVASKEVDENDAKDPSEGAAVDDTDIASIYATGELAVVEPEDEAAEEAAAGDTVTLDEEETAPASERSRALFWRNDG